MSFGGSGSNQSQSAQSTQTQTLDPQIKQALLTNAADLPNNVAPYSPYSGTDVAPLSAMQNQGIAMVGDIANNQTGAAPVNSAIQATQGIVGNAAPTAQAGLVDMSKVPTVTAGNVGQTDLSPYLNPYMSNVVNTTSAAANNALQLQQNQNASDATKLGAWRGNGLSVENGVDAAQSNVGLANTIAGLESQGYTTALDTATADQNRALSAAQGNQSTTLSGLTTNAGNTQATNLANQGAQLSQEQLGLAGAQQLAGLGGQQLTDAAQRANLVEQAGGVQQQQSQAQLDWLYQNNYIGPQQYAMSLQQLKNQTLGLAGNPTLSSGQSTSQGTGSSMGFNLSV